jgi:proteasome activator subunit 4
MKSLRYIKLRTYSGSTKELALCNNHNPIRQKVSVTERTSEFTAQYLEAFKKPIDRKLAQQQPYAVSRVSYNAFLYPYYRCLQDKPASGWLVWEDVDMYRLPDDTKSTFQPWEEGSAGAIQTVRNAASRADFWEKLSSHFAQENHQETTSADNISCVKSICTRFSIAFYSN